MTRYAQRFTGIELAVWLAGMAATLAGALDLGGFGLWFALAGFVILGVGFIVFSLGRARARPRP